MKILYVHGFGSHFDPKHEKIIALETIGTVVGVNVDYCRGFPYAKEVVTNAVIDEQVDLIVGTSMGGYIAAHVGAATGVPFVSLNPAIAPHESLMRWVGTFTDYTGQDHYLPETAVSTYPYIATSGCGLVIVETGDEVIDARATERELEGHYRVEVFSGGSHRFTHIKQALELIKDHYAKCEAGYGA